MSLFHICTKGLYKGLIRRDEDDFRQSVNSTAVAAELSGVSIVAFEHLSNHSHFIAAAESAEMTCNFINRFKIDESRKSHNKYGTVRLLDRVAVESIELNSKRYAKVALAYTHNNVVGHGLFRVADEYRWSSHRAYIEDVNPLHEIVPVSALHQVERRKLLKTHHSFGGSRLLYDRTDGMILCQSFVDSATGLSLYDSLEEYLEFFHRKDIMDEFLDCSGRKTPLIVPDEEVLLQATLWAKEWFGMESVLLLRENQKVRLARYLRNKFRSYPSQLSRVLGLDIDVMSRL